MLLIDSGDDSNEEHKSWSQDSADVTVAYSMDESEGGSEVAGSQDSCSLPTVFKELHFWYVDPDGRKVLNKDQAAVTINGMTILNYFDCHQGIFLLAAVDHLNV